MSNQGQARVGAYARYSSDKQSEASIEDQLRRLRTHASREGQELDGALVFTDYAISGASSSRPGLDALMAKVRNREIDMLLVESVDRLSRNLADGSRMREEFDYYGVRLVAVADGIDTKDKSAKLTADIKGVFASMYLADLSDKTSRGMQGRALAGMSTGGLPIGYRSAPIAGADPRASTGRTVEVDSEGAALVRRIFALYVDGGSIHGIAQRFNAEHVPSPRDRMKHAQKRGWAGTTIRAVLANTKYVGTWTFGERRWVKVPGTNRRVPQKADPSTIIRQERPELAIIDRETWDLAQAKLGRTRALFTIGKDGRRKGKAARADIAHPLSGLIHCKCGAAMTIIGKGSDTRYYGCPTARRGRCAIATSVREDDARAAILEELRETIASPNAIACLRRELALLIGDFLRKRTAELKERRGRLQRTEKRLANIVAAIADGERGQTLSDALRDLEAQAEEERRGIGTLEASERAPVALPDPGVLLERCIDLERRLAANPAGAREELHELFKGQTVTLELGADGIYVAKGIVLPLKLLARGKTLEGQEPLRSLILGGVPCGRSSGGRI